MIVKIVLLLLLSINCHASSTFIRDLNSDFFLKVNSDGSVNANIIPSGPGLVVNSPLSLAGPSGIPILSLNITDSIALCGSSLCLSGDSASPAASSYYGTNGAGTLGYYSLPTGSGTVTTVSVASANGFTGTVANATTTPAITLTTSVTGVLKGNGTAISAAGDADITAKLLTGYVSGSGTVASTDTILQGIQKLNGNVALDLPLAGGTMSGVIVGSPTASSTAAFAFDGSGNTGVSNPTALALGVRTNGSQRMFFDGTGHTTWGTTTAGAAQVTIQNIGDVTAGGLRLDNNTAASNAHWDFWSQSAGNLMLNNNNQSVRYMFGFGGGMAVGGNGTAAQAALELRGSTSNTSVGSVALINGNVQSNLLSITNTDTTAGNLSSLVFGTDGTKWESGIFGVHDVHTTAQSGHLEFWTGLASALTKALVLNSVGPQFPVSGSGVTPTCASGKAGTVNFTSAYIECVCNGSSWVKTSDGSTACTF